MVVDIQDRAIKDLSKIDKFQAKKIFNKIVELEKYPNLSNIKKLTNHNPSHRLRVGNYRVLFSIEDDVIIVVSVEHRKESY